MGSYWDHNRIITPVLNTFRLFLCLRYAKYSSSPFFNGIMASTEHPHDHHPADDRAGPDMRYLSPAYLPLLFIEVYALKHAGLNGDGVGEALRVPHPSIPRNPLIAEPLFLTRYIEKAGTGTLDMIEQCARAGLPPPEFRQNGGQFIQVLWRPKRDRMIGAQTGDQVGTKLGLSGDQVEVLRTCVAETSMSELMDIAGRTNRTKFRNSVLKPLMQAGLIEMTIPDRPRSSNQKYRVTERGRALLAGRDMP